MRKLFCTICDRCRKVVDITTCIKYYTKGKELHFCNTECFNKHIGPKKGLPPKPIKK